MPGHIPSSVAIASIPECVRHLRAPIPDSAHAASAIEVHRHAAVTILSCVDDLREPALDLLGRYQKPPTEAYQQELRALASLAVPVFRNHVESP
jgi:hypothetical protein